MNHQELSPILFLERAKKNFANEIAVITRKKSYSYKEFYDIVQKLAGFLQNLALQYGDKIAIIAPNSFTLLLAHYAIPMIGCVLVPINHKLKSNSILHILKNSDSKILIAKNAYIDNEFFGYVEKIIIDDFGFEEDSMYGSQNERLTNILNGDDTKSEIKFLVKSEHDTISINYTSGTTNLAKGVECTHRGTYLNSLGECIEIGLSRNTKYLWVLPMTHCNGWCFTWAVTAVGAQHVCVLEDYNPENIIDAVVNYKITHFCAAPTLLKFIAFSSSFHKLKNLNLTIVTAGSFPEETVIKKFLEYNIKIIPVYGLTETYGPISIVSEKENWENISLEFRANHLASQGMASIHGHEVKVVDENGIEIAYDGKTSGEIIIKSNSLMKGYYNDIEETKKVFIDGWFYTGDLAIVSSDGYIKIIDRKKDIIISGGEKISSIEVETVLMKHPYVELAAVLPLKSDKWGEVPQAVVQLKENLVSDQELIQFCKNNLESYKCPQKIIFSNIPISANGKILKKELLKTL